MPSHPRISSPGATDAGRRHRHGSNVGANQGEQLSTKSRPKEKTDNAVSRTGAARPKPALSALRRNLQPAVAGNWIVYVACVLLLFLSFFITLRLIRSDMPPRVALTVLAQSAVTDPHSLMAAVRAAGLKGSPEVKGNIDGITRIDGKRVRLTGWAAQLGRDRAPLAVIGFVDGTASFAVETAGAHAHVDQVLGLSAANTATNVSFQGVLACARGQKLIVIAVADNNAYGYFGTRTCP